MGTALLLALVTGGGCREAKPLSPEAQAFRQQVHIVLERLAVPLGEPAAKEDSKAVQAILVRLFGLCASDCQNLVDRVVVLDKDGVTISFYPPAKNPEWRFADYSAVQKAILEKRPVQSVMYRQDGTILYTICAPILFQEKVSGVIVLVLDRVKVRQTLGLSEQEFLALDLRKKATSGSGPARN